MNKKNLPKAIWPTKPQNASAAPVAATMAAAPEVPETSPKAKQAVAQEQAALNAADAKERRARAIAVVKRLSLWSGAAGLIPVPFVDTAAVGGVQLEMLRRISKIYDVPFSKNSGKALIASFAGSMIPASSGIGAASLVKGVPGIGTAVSAVTMPALSIGATFAIGMAFIQHFASGGTLLDFNPPDYREFLKAEKASAKGAASQPV